jgi:hypothetical protein
MQCVQGQRAADERGLYHDRPATHKHTGMLRQSAESHTEP